MAVDFVVETAYFGGLARLVACSPKADERGVLQPFDFDQMPFKPVRAFAVGSVPAGTVRGGHAHRSGTQLLVCLQGRIGILMRHRDQEATLVMEPSGVGLALGAGVWCQQTYLVEGTVLLAFADTPYDPASYSEHWA